MKSILLFFTAMTLSSCMHVGMMGTGGGHHGGTAREITSESVLEKEVTVGGVRAIAIFPPLELGKEVLFTLRLVDATTSQPLTRATVSLHATYVHDPATGHVDSSSGANQHRERHGEVRTETGHDVDFTQLVDESPEPGIYTIAYVTHQPGTHMLMFHISALGDRKLDPEVIVEATRAVPAETHSHREGIMRGTSATTYLIVGVAIMVAMLATRGAMF